MGDLSVDLRWAHPPQVDDFQIAEIGYGSQLVVIVTGAFTGAVFTAQAYFQFASLNMETAVGPVVTLSMFRELGPV